MKTLLLVVLSIALISCYATKWHELEGYTFQHYKKEFLPTYSNEAEELYRERLFNEKLAEIRRHNADPTKSWKLGVNRFTDRTHEEFKSLLGVKKGLLRPKPMTAEFSKIDISPYANQTVDWRNKGIITSVKDQGQCGSCWSFATAETLEAYWALKTKQLVDLSEQQVLDCTPNPDDCGGNGGCGGGTVELAYTNIAKRGGLATEWTYPYQSYMGSNFQCRFDQSNTPPFASVTGYKALPSNVYEPLLQHIATVGPLAISVDAGTWNTYESGVYDGCNKTHPDLDHAVQLVGYGTDSQDGDYWLVRNSWGPAWGEDGYIRLRRTSEVECGVDLSPSDGDGCNGGPSKVTVCGTCGILYDTVYPTVTTN